LNLTLTMPSVAQDALPVPAEATQAATAQLDVAQPDEGQPALAQNRAIAPNTNETAGPDPIETANSLNPSVGVAPEIAPDPFPSPLRDPAGAVRWLLTQTDGQGGQGHHLSPIGMYRGADIVVKLVMLGLIFASFATWTVWVAKTLELWGARRRARRALKVLSRVGTLTEAQGYPQTARGVIGRMLAEACDEVIKSEPALKHAGGGGLKERVAAALGRIEAQAGRRMARGTGVLATIGSTAPFVGLFGTVWGIMNSFIAIAESNTTNLAVVAPGIAEALLATAIGLVAAIPAVVIYNLFARAIAGYRMILGDAGERIERLVSRDLDRGLVPADADVSSQVVA
jgi:biopolymer transport protein ExbB